ncbi:MAG: hypothetical protein ACUVS7_09985 [Bryobacteraceae bacterium]
MATLHRSDGCAIAYIQGAAETLLPRCEAGPGSGFAVDDATPAGWNARPQ